MLKCIKEVGRRFGLGVLVALAWPFAVAYVIYNPDAIDMNDYEDECDCYTDEGGIITLESGKVVDAKHLGQGLAGVVCEFIRKAGEVVQDAEIKDRVLTCHADGRSDERFSCHSN